MISFGWKHAGLITIWKKTSHTGGINIHIFPMTVYQRWGFKKYKTRREGVFEFGLGPLLLVVKTK